MATGKSVKSLGSSSSRASITKAVSKPKTTTTSKVSVPTKTSTISLRKAATPSSSSGSSSSSSAGKSFAPVASASNAARSNITSAVNKAAASKSSTWSSSNAGKSVSSLTNASNSTRSKITNAVNSRSSGRSSGGSSSSSSSKTAKSVAPLVESSNEHRSNLTNAINDNISSKVLDNYDRASNTNYTNAYNHLRSQWMSDEDASAAAAGLLENENLLKTKSDDEIAMETQSNNDDEDYDYFNDIINWEEEEEEEPYYPDFDGLFWDYIDRYERRINDLESQLESNTVKTSVPEERDTSYDYNTYYQENLAPDKMYENWVSKNDLNDKPQVTLVSQYQEPVSTALNDLWLLTPNEAVTNATQNAEEPGLPKGYESWEAIVDDFNNALQEISEDSWLTPQAVAQTYSDFKNQLVQYANTNNMSPEEYKALLRQLQGNNVLREVLLNNSRKWLANRNLM